MARQKRKVTLERKKRVMRCPKCGCEMVFNGIWLDMRVHLRCPSCDYECISEQAEKGER